MRVAGGMNAGRHPCGMGVAGGMNAARHWCGMRVAGGMNAARHWCGMRVAGGMNAGRHPCGMRGAGGMNAAPTVRARCRACPGPDIAPGRCRSRYQGQSRRDCPWYHPKNPVPLVAAGRGPRDTPGQAAVWDANRGRHECRPALVRDAGRGRHECRPYGGVDRHIPHRRDAGRRRHVAACRDRSTLPGPWAGAGVESAVTCSASRQPANRTAPR